MEELYFQMPGEFFGGCWAYNSSAYTTLNLKKSINSAAASISACQAFFPCPRIVAAITSYLYFPAIRSAAFRKMAALSAKGRFSHSGLAARAASMAADTWAGEACDEDARAVPWAEGIFWRTTELVVMDSELISRGTDMGALERRDEMAASRAARSAEPLA